ncbi:cytochrome c-type biogenesis CcmF C-terminal domain-containing protein [Escherichia coli]
MSEKRATFKAWTVLLALGLLAQPAGYLPGALRRAGIGGRRSPRIPTRGLFILGFLLAVIGSSLLLFAFKGSQVRESRQTPSCGVARPCCFATTSCWVVVLLTVLLGTLLPLVHKELGLGSISIGTPFFNHIYSGRSSRLPCCWGLVRCFAGGGIARVRSAIY